MDEKMCGEEFYEHYLFVKKDRLNYTNVAGQFQS